MSALHTYALALIHALAYVFAPFTFTDSLYNHDDTAALIYKQKSFTRHG